MNTYRAVQLASVLHRKSQKYGIEQFQVDIYFQEEKYRILIFNHDFTTPKRVIFAKVKQNEIPSSICVFEEKSYVHEGEELVSFINQLDEEIIEGLLRSNGKYLLRTETYSQRLDRLMDRYNDYQTLYETTQDPHYQKKAIRLVYLVHLFVFNKK